MSRRKERLRRLFWPHRQVGWPRSPNLWQWSAGRITEHPDYLPSLEAYVEVVRWMDLRPHASGVNGERGEMLHILRPLLELSCRGSTPCVYAEVGDYCGLAMGFALTFPRLDEAVQVGRRPVSERGCIDMRKSPLDVVEHDRDATALCKSRLACLWPTHNASVRMLVSNPSKLAYASELRHVSVLLLGVDANESQPNVAATFDRYARHVILGGAVVFDAWTCGQRSWRCA